MRLVFSEETKNEAFCLTQTAIFILLSMILISFGVSCESAVLSFGSGTKLIIIIFIKLFFN